MSLKTVHSLLKPNSINTLQLPHTNAKANTNNYIFDKSAWDTIFQYNQIINKSAAKLISRTIKHEHITLMFAKLNWLAVN